MNEQGRGKAGASVAALTKPPIASLAPTPQPAIKMRRALIKPGAAQFGADRRALHQPNVLGATDNWCPVRRTLV